MRKRVVITGAGVTTPFGVGFDAMMEGLKSGKPALSLIPEDKKVENIECHVAGLVPPIDKKIPREIRRSMSPMSIFAYLAAVEALERAKAEPGEDIGVCVGSTLGSGQETESVYKRLIGEGNIDQVRSMAFFKIMGHSVASNLALALKLGGRIISPAAACSTGLQAVGLAYETIACGREKAMLAGGADEFSFLASATFYKIGAASSETDPMKASRPFDQRRTGVVCGEGGGILFLEDLDRALERKAPILAEIKGFATIASNNIAILDQESTLRCMNAALIDANIKADQISYISAHATGTVIGDVAEGKAIEKLFGNKTPVSSLKGQLGHTLAASGAIELAATLGMMRDGELIGQVEDFIPDEKCGNTRFAKTGESFKKGPVLKNSFALGGVFSSLILSPFEEKNES